MGAVQPVTITLSSLSAVAGGELVFSASRAAVRKPSITLSLPVDGSSVTAFVSGKFGSPSRNDRDVSIVVSAGATVIGELPVMVRIRKDATALTADERDRFIEAMAQLNNRGTGRFADFRNMHVYAAQPEAHGAPAFLPWHRAYLLGLERELQAIDPAVALPYWRFDRPAPNVFTPEFLGAADRLGTVGFSVTNPLQYCSTDSTLGITRRPKFDTATRPPGLLTEAATLKLGKTYAKFSILECNPHGSAHTSFGGSISSVPTAAKDPLFFRLHANVDRLWAKWQRQNARFDPTVADSFDTPATGQNRIGHNLGDTMWPWNGDVAPPRPATAPGGSLSNSPTVDAPDATPTVTSWPTAVKVTSWPPFGSGMENERWLWSGSPRGESESFAPICCFVKALAYGKQRAKITVTSMFQMDFPGINQRIPHPSFPARCPALPQSHDTVAQRWVRCSRPRRWLEH